MPNQLINNPPNPRPTPTSPSRGRPARSTNANSCVSVNHTTPGGPLRDLRARSTGPSGAPPRWRRVWSRSSCRLRTASNWCAAWTAARPRGSVLAHGVLKTRSGVETAARASRVQRDRSRTARLLGQSVALHLKTGFTTARKQIQGATRGTRSPSTRPGPRHRLFFRAHAINTSELCLSKASFGPALRSLNRRSATVV